MDINTILRTNGRQVNNSQYTFSIYNTNQKWFIPTNNMGNFFRDYCQFIKEAVDEYSTPKGNNQLAIGGLLEKRTNDMPIVMEVNLKYDEEPSIPYDDLFIRKIVSIIQNAIQLKYSLSDYDDPDLLLSCIYTETSMPVIILDKKNKQYLYQVRLYFPFMRVESKSIEELRKQVVVLLRQKNVLRQLDRSPIGDWDNIMRTFINNPIPLYGCSEKPEYPPCVFNCAFGNMSEWMNDDESLSECNEIDVEDILDFDNHALINTGVVDESIFENFEQIDLLPFFLSGYARAQTIQSHTESGSVGTPQQLMSITDFSSRHYKTDAEMSTELLEIISIDRFLHKKRWIEIGKAIHNSFRGTDAGLTIWIDITERALRGVRGVVSYLENSNIRDACFNEYNEFTWPGQITVKTLAWFAMEDNKEQYNIWHRNWTRSYRQDCYNLSHDSIAKALYCELWLTHACHVRGKARTVYEFSQHRWQKVEDGYTIRMEISDGFKRQFELDRADIAFQMTQTNDETEKKRLQTQHDVVNQLIKFLGNRGFKASVLGEVLDRLTIANFEGYLDKNGDLTGHPNGVSEVDIELCSIEFRPGKPEDYLTKVTSAKLDLTLSWDHPRVKEYMQWMSEMFMDPGTNHFIHKLWASGFVAGNFDKIGPMFTGDKNNGKTTLSNFIMRTWGNYAVKFPTTGITKGYSESGSANPAMVRVSGPRWGLADEPDAREKFHAGPFKRIFSPDDFYSRGLYSEGGDLQNTCTVTVWANKIPPFPDADDACRVRLCCIPCLTTYVKEGAPETREEQIAKRILPMKKTFQNNVNKLRNAALWVHYQYFPIWCKESLDSWPEEIKNATNEYWSDNDIYQMYMSDRIDANAGENEFVTVTELYKDFELWFNMYNKGETVPDRPTVKYHMTQHTRKTIDNKWYGIQIKKDTKDNEVLANAMKQQIRMETLTGSPGLSQNNYTSTNTNEFNPYDFGSMMTQMTKEDMDSLGELDLGLAPIPTSVVNQGKSTITIEGGKIVTKPLQRGPEQENIVLTTLPIQ